MKLKKIFITTMLAVAITSMVGCSSKDSQAKDSYKSITGAQAQQIMKDSNDILILDVRDDNEYNEGHISNAINIPVDEVEKRIGELEQYKDKTVLVYCRVGKRSATASEVLVKNGFKDVSNLEDGVEEYDYEIVK